MIGAMKVLWVMFFSLVSFPGIAATAPRPVTIAVIDTGFDLDNEVLRPRLKLGETDEEAAEKVSPQWRSQFSDNSHLKQSVLSGAPLHQVLMYRSLKAKSHQEGLTPEESMWVEMKKLDPEFREKLRQFKRHVHGTIVAGIAVQEGEGLSVFPVRGLGIDIPTLVVEGEAEAASATPVVTQSKNSEAEFLRQVKLSEQRVIRKMRRMLDYIAQQRIQVVNASYGVTEKHITSRFNELHKEITGLVMDPLRMRETVDAYFERLYRQANALIARHPQTLFVFSAGNLGQDNGLTHHFPSRLRRSNVLTVAALNGDALAAFSNWSKEYVDIAAPGVGVSALLPSVYTKEAGVGVVPASGTSMAAPYVSNVAARCLQLNQSLTGSELKQIIMETGDPLPSLTLRLVSGMRINPERALRAAELSNTQPTVTAIQAAIITTESSSLLKDLVTVPPDKSDPPHEERPSPPPAPAETTSESP